MFRIWTIIKKINIKKITVYLPLIISILANVFPLIVLR